MILTTTDTGLLGSNIQFDYALNRDHCDLHDYKSVSSIIKEVNPSGIIHFAGRLQPASQVSYSNHHGILDNNLRIDLNIIRAAVENKIRNVLSISSISAYGEMSELPYKVEDLFKGDSNRKYYGYSTSKRLTIDLNRTVRLDTGWNYKTILLGNIFGPFEKFNSEGTIVGKTIGMIENCIENSEDLHLWGDGKELRSLTYVKDLKSLMAMILIDEDCPGELNSGNGELISISDLVHLIAKVMNFSGKIKFNGVNASTSHSSKFADLSLFQAQYPKFQFTPLEEGLRETVEWFRHNKG
jgi:GDP-L-fucose synthase